MPTKEEILSKFDNSRTLLQQWIDDNDDEELAEELTDLQTRLDELRDSADEILS